MNDFWYFGCFSAEKIGHYLFTKFDRRTGVLKDDRLPFPTALLDGTFCPLNTTPGLWRIVKIHGRNHRTLTILSGWDCTADKRPASCAVFVSDGNLSFDEMATRAKEIFPDQWERVTSDKQPMVLVPE